MEYILVGMGGAFGSVTRYLLGKFISSRTKSKIPMGTFIINITGALFLGILAGNKIDKSIYIFLAEGFLGAYTTFSTFMYEGFNLLEDREKLNAFIYILGSLFIGILGFSIGFRLIRI